MKDAELLRFSLVFVWLATAIASVLGLEGQSRALLSNAGVTDPVLSRTLILGGAAVDAALGLLMWLRPRRATYLAALAMMAVMTLVATALAPALWLDPLGSLTKNLPIAAALWLLARRRA
ncbi:MAG: DoxX-like family protein [Pseudomonadota bacterium]